MPALNPQAFADALLAALPAKTFDTLWIARPAFMLGAYRAAQRMVVMAPKVPEHVAADVTACYRNVASASQIPELRAAMSFLGTPERAAALLTAAAAVWPTFFARG